MAAGIYVEILIHGTMDEVWEKTQNPQLHKLWDLRFTDIEYLPRSSESEPQRFLYATKIGFGLALKGEGETLGTRDDASGSRTSSLKFWSENPVSLISEGSGYWKYIPTPEGIKFLTWYDYKTRFGPLGALLDGMIFRPLMGWATAWSFDRLRRWIEDGLPPQATFSASMCFAIARCALSFVWIYQGLIPKLVFKHQDEMTMLSQAGISYELAGNLLMMLGAAEIIFGLTLLIWWQDRKLLWMNVILMIAALAAVSIKSPGYLVAAFNPVALNLSMLALSAGAIALSPYIPTAKTCKRTKPESD